MEWNEISKQKLSDDFMIEHVHQLQWYIVSEIQTVSEHVIRTLKDEIEWDLICCYQNLSESFMEEHCDYLFWTIVSKKQILSEDFIRKYQDKVNWKGISQYQTLSEPFIEEMEKHISWEMIFRFQPIPYSFITKHFSHLRAVHELFENPYLKDSFSKEQWKKLYERFMTTPF